MTKMSVFRRVVVGCWMGSLSLIVAAGDPPAATPKPSPPRPQKACAATEFRQFDFWLGDWKVTDPKGDVAGTNRITLEMDGCVLHEHWVGSKGGNGESFNIYDGATKQWHQTWVDNGGTLLLWVFADHSGPFFVPPYLRVLSGVDFRVVHRA